MGSLLAKRVAIEYDLHYRGWNVIQKTKIVFHVDGTVEGQQNYVIGRCGDAPIRLNDVFTAVCQYEPRRSLDEFNTAPRLRNTFPITLRVQGIQAYRRHLNELGEGMTGTLFLMGDDINKIGPDALLEGIVEEQKD